MKDVHALQYCNINTILFLTFTVLVANPEKLLYMVANPARDPLGSERRKEKGETETFCHFPPGWGMLRRSRCVQIFLQTTKRESLAAHPLESAVLVQKMSSLNVKE